MSTDLSLSGLSAPSAYDADVTDALVRLASRTLLPLQLRGATARPVTSHRIAQGCCQSCVGVRLSGKRPLQLEWASIRLAEVLDPVWAVMLYVFDADDNTVVAVRTLLERYEDDLCDAPFAQWIAAIDALDAQPLQRAAAEWLTAVEGTCDE